MATPEEHWLHIIDRLSALGQKRATRVIYYLALIVILGMALMPQAGEPGFPQADKVMHFLLFALLAVGGRLTHQRTPAPYLAAGLLFYGGVMELMQGMTSWRTASGGDLLADGLGILAGLAAARLRNTRGQRL